MESTQNKIYEIEESAIVDQSLKQNFLDDDLGEEVKNGKRICSYSRYRLRFVCRSV